MKIQQQKITYQDIPYLLITRTNSPQKIKTVAQQQYQIHTKTNKQKTTQQHIVHKINSQYNRQHMEQGQPTQQSLSPNQNQQQSHSESQNTDKSKSKSKSKGADKVGTQHSQVSIDTQLIKAKQQLLYHFYAAADDRERLMVMKKWPNQQLQAILATNGQYQCSQNDTNHHITRTNNAWYFGNTSNQMLHGYGLLIYEQVRAKIDRTEARYKNPTSNNNNNNSNSNHNSNTSTISHNNNGQPLSRFYQGQFQNNCKHGYGLEYIASDIYIGHFVNNKPEDQNGIFLWKNGDLYIGGFVNGMKHGHGRWESGQEYYEGTWKLNKPEGMGKISTYGSQYEGDVRNGYKHGRGIQIFLNGDRYQGHYANGKPEGDGIYSWKNGAVYKGQFKNGIRYGYGSWSFGSQSYEGDYINDKRNGQGIYKWAGQSYYKGQFLDDLRHGIGQMHWNQNSYYKGQWKDGVQCGQGQIWEDGKIVNKGLFQDGKFIKQPNKLQKSHATQSNYSNSRTRYQKNHVHGNHHNNSYNIVKEHIRNTSSKKSQQRQYQREKRASSTRYPMIDKKDRSHSNANNRNLSQIDEFPKVAQKTNSNMKNKKYAVSTSFSHHARTSGISGFSNPKTSIHHQSFQSGHRDLKQFDQQPQTHFFKRNQQLIDTPNKLSSVQKQKKVNTSSKKLNYQKRKLQGFSTRNQTKQVESSDVNILNSLDSQLGPIKWKNFTHMKNNAGEMSSG